MEVDNSVTKRDSFLSLNSLLNDLLELSSQGSDIDEIPSPDFKINFNNVKVITSSGNWENLRSQTTAREAMNNDIQPTQIEVSSNRKSLIKPSSRKNNIMTNIKNNIVNSKLRTQNKMEIASQHHRRKAPGWTVSLSKTKSNASNNVNSIKMHQRASISSAPSTSSRSNNNNPDPKSKVVSSRHVGPREYLEKNITSDSLVAAIEETIALVVMKSKGSSAMMELFQRDLINATSSKMIELCLADLDSKYGLPSDTKRELQEMGEILLERRLTEERLRRS